MIEGFIGLIGGGKTYSAVMRLARAVGSGCRVATNININRAGFRRYVKDEFSFDMDEEQVQILDESQIMRFWNHVPKGTADTPLLVVIDEAPEYIDSVGMKNGDDQKAFHSFCRQSRKFEQNLILISQDMSFLQKRIRALVAYTWRFRDMAQMIIPGLGIRWPLNQIRQLQFDRESKIPCRSFWHWKDRRVFESYNTFELFNRGLGPPAAGRVDFRKQPSKKETRMSNALQWATLAASVALLLK